MATDGEALKRLGAGRWQTRDGRFTIEPQSGSWVVIDDQQTDDLDMPLVRGPFGSLTAAREAIEMARIGDVPVSPLAARVEEARQRPRAGQETIAMRRPSAAQHRAPAPPPPPPSRPEPTWIGELPSGRRAAARSLVDRLGALGIEDAEMVARVEAVDGEPALARLAIGRRIAKLLTVARDQDELVAALLDLMASGDDETLGVRWRLVDGVGRPIGSISGRTTRG